MPLDKVNKGEEILSVVGKIESEEIRSKISDLSKANEVIIQAKSEVSFNEIVSRSFK